MLRHYVGLDQEPVVTFGAKTDRHVAEVVPTNLVGLHRFEVRHNDVVNDGDDVGIARRDLCFTERNLRVRRSSSTRTVRNQLTTEPSAG